MRPKGTLVLSGRVHHRLIGREILRRSCSEHPSRLLTAHNALRGSGAEKSGGRACSGHWHGPGVILLLLRHTRYGRNHMQAAVAASCCQRTLCVQTEGPCGKSKWPSPRRRFKLQSRKSATAEALTTVNAITTQFPFPPRPRLWWGFSTPFACPSEYARESATSGTSSDQDVKK